MSNKTTTCPRCGIVVVDTEHCSICGEPLHTQGPDVTTGVVNDNKPPVSEEASSASEDASVTQLTDMVSPPTFDIDIDAIERESLVLLLARSELAVIDGELNKLIEQIQATRHALTLKAADRVLLRRRFEELQESLKRIIKRRDALQALQGKLPIEKIIDEIESMTSKMRALEKNRATLDSGVYRKQTEQLESELYLLEDQLRATIWLTESWLRAIQKKKGELQDELDLLDAKYKIGDTSREVYEASKTKNTRSLLILNGGYMILNDLLTRAKKLL